MTYQYYLNGTEVPRAEAMEAVREHNGAEWGECDPRFIEKWAAYFHQQGKPYWPVDGVLEVRIGE